MLVVTVIKELDKWTKSQMHVCAPNTGGRQSHLFFCKYICLVLADICVLCLHICSNVQFLLANICLVPGNICPASN